MVVIDIKSHMPTQLVAGKLLADAIKRYKGKEKIIKILHGYGSTGIGGSIKVSTHKSLKNHMNKGEIKAYIPGEAIKQTLGFDHLISQYKTLISHDEDFKRDNYGITYVIL